LLYTTTNHCRLRREGYLSLFRGSGPFGFYDLACRSSQALINHWCSSISSKPTSRLLGQEKRGPAAEENYFHWRDRTSERQWPSAISSHVGISENIELLEELICSRESTLHVYKNPHATEREMDISRSSVRRIAKHDLRLKIYKRLSGLLSFDRWRHFIFQRCFKKLRLNEVMLRIKQR